jgi:hypothetical protein
MVPKLYFGVMFVVEATLQSTVIFGVICLDLRFWGMLKQAYYRNPIGNWNQNNAPKEE